VRRRRFADRRQRIIRLRCCSEHVDRGQHRGRRAVGFGRDGRLGIDERLGRERLGRHERRVVHATLRGLVQRL
jgi:hypothetical protein